MQLLLVLSSLGTLLALVNSATMRVLRVRPHSSVSSTVSILVPMRNEENNVDALVTSVQSSEGLDHSEFLILNDNSTDTTAQLLAQSQASVINGAELPMKWFGKPWACHQLAHRSIGTYLVFLDADVRIHPKAIASAIELMNELEWDFISPHPRQIALSFIERIFQPLLQWSWLASVPLRIAERFGITSMTIANGQFFIVKRDAYFAVGGHEAIKAEILDDLRLARILVDGGFRGGVTEASALAQTRMYTTTKDLIDGYTKSLWTAFGGFFGTVVAVCLLVATQILPLLLGVAGYAYGWIAYAITALSHAVAALRTRSSTANVFLHPLAAFLLLVMLAESLRRKNSGQLTWRGRTVN